MSWISSKKRKKEFNFTTMIPQVNLFSLVFLEETEDTKKPFRNYLTFSTQWNVDEIFRLKFHLG